MAPSRGSADAIDPAARGRSQVDGRQLIQMYLDQGLKLREADNAVEAGIYRVWQRMSSGRLKVFRSCQNWFAEFGLYRRDEKGRVVKERDHLMDATRYLEMELPGLGQVTPQQLDPGQREIILGRYPHVGPWSWMG